MSNLRKHIDFLDVPRLFAGRHFEIEDDREDYGEKPRISVGMIYETIALCVWTPRKLGTVRRIISLRKADDDEAQDYLEDF